jgi:hypothetical protein
MKGWCNVRKGAEYGGQSERCFREHLKNGMKHSRLPSGSILIKFHWIDEYFESFAKTKNQVDKIVDDVTADLL